MFERWLSNHNSIIITGSRVYLASVIISPCIFSRILFFVNLLLNHLFPGHKKPILSDLKFLRQHVIVVGWLAIPIVIMMAVDHWDFSRQIIVRSPNCASGMLVPVRPSSDVTI